MVKNPKVVVRKFSSFFAHIKNFNFKAFTAKDSNKNQENDENGRLITESIIEQSEDDEDHDHNEHAAHQHKTKQNSRQINKNHSNLINFLVMFNRKHIKLQCQSRKIFQKSKKIETLSKY